MGSKIKLLGLLLISGGGAAIFMGILNIMIGAGIIILGVLMLLFGGKKKGANINSVLYEMEMESKDAFDKGDTKKAEKIHDRMALINKQLGNVRKKIENELSAKTIKAGFRDSQSYLRSKGWNKSVQEYIDTEATKKVA